MLYTGHGPVRARK